MEKRFAAEEIMEVLGMFDIQYSAAIRYLAGERTAEVADGLRSLAEDIDEATHHSGDFTGEILEAAARCIE